MAAKKTPRNAALHAARDPQTPAPVLETLYQNARRHYDSTTHRMVEEKPDVMAALAQNPNMPPRFLLLLLTGYPEAVCKNPVVPLLPLEMPTFWSDAREEDVLNLLRLLSVPPSVLQTLAVSGKPSVQNAARLHIGLAGELDPNNWQNAVREACRNEAQPPYPQIEPLFADWVEIGLMPASWWHENAVTEPKLAYEPQMNEGRPSFVSAKERLATLPPDASPEYLHKLTEGRVLMDSPVMIAVALHPNTGPETLRHLGRQRENNLGMAVVLHPNTPPDTLRAFAEGNYKGDRLRQFASGRHPNADADVLRVLAADGDPTVRRLARRHPNTPADLTALSRTAALTPAKTLTNDKNHAQLWFIFYALEGKPSMGWLRKYAASEHWMKRLGVALALARRASERAASAKPGKVSKISEGEQDLRKTLQSDANRLVRAVANTPTAPVFDFAL